MIIIKSTDGEQRAARPYPQIVKEVGVKEMGQLVYLDAHQYCDFLRVYGNAKDRPMVDLYKVIGIAPSYTHPASGIAYKDLQMNWWVLRNNIMAINYIDILGTENYSVDQMLGVNQLFLKEEAEVWKKWLDDIYPEENTWIEKVEYPVSGVSEGFMDFNPERGYGSLMCFEIRWLYDFQICYYIDVRGVEIIKKDK